MPFSVSTYRLHANGYDYVSSIVRGQKIVREEEGRKDLKKDPYWTKLRIHLDERVIVASVRKLRYRLHGRSKSARSGLNLLPHR